MERQERLDRLLDYLEEHIDPEHAEQAVRRQYQAINFLPVDRIPLIIQIKAPFVEFEPLPFEQAFYDHESMLYNELLYSWGSIYHSVSGGLQDDYIYHIRSSTGPVLVSSMLGANCRVAGEFAWVDPMEREELEALIKRGVPSVQSGLLPMVFERYAYYHERLSAYPNCAKAIRVTPPDLQGPFGTAHLLEGQDIFMDLYEDPDFVHELLEITTQATIDAIKAFEPYIQNCIVRGEGHDAEVVYAAMYRGRAVIKDDSASIMISEPHYEEFSEHYNHRIMDELGEAGLHHCGVGRSWHPKHFIYSTNGGVNFGQPQFHKLEEKMCYLENGVPIVGWGSEEPYKLLDDFYRLAPKTGMTLACLATSTDEAKRIYERHLERCENLEQSGAVEAFLRRREGK